ncbi:MAG: hypothetical protein QM760_10005 [Nibricoccus sp.]
MSTGIEMGIFLADGRTDFRPGETLGVSALWALSEKPATLEVRLFWYTRGKGAEDVGVIAVQTIENAGAAGERSLSFKLPSQPWSFSGKLISLIWAVELVAEPGGHSARAEFALSPDGAEILLHGDGTTLVKSGG